jgi:hypothetical protein
MQRWIAGRTAFPQMLARGDARLLGPSRLARAFPGWFDTSLWADGFRRADERRTREAAPAGV